MRAKMFLDTLSREYMRYTLQSEFDINENTLNYIDKQLAEVTVILEQHGLAQGYGREQEYHCIWDVRRRCTSRNSSATTTRRIRSIQLKSMESLEDYVLNSEDEKLLRLPRTSRTMTSWKQTLGSLYSMQMARTSERCRTRPMLYRVGSLHQLHWGYSTHVHQECEACHRAEDGRCG